MEQKVTQSYFDQIFKIFSFLYIILITCGLTYNYFYYKHFGINITSFIDLSEALMLFIPTIAGDPFLVSCLVSLMMSFILKSQFSKVPLIKMTEEFTRKLKRILLIIFFTLVGSVLILVVLNTFLSNFEFTILHLCTIIVSFFIPFILELYLTGIRVNLSEELKNALYVVLILVFSVMIRAYSKATRFKNKRDYQSFEFIVENPRLKIKSDSSTYLLGRTRNYIFIYDFKDSTTNILNVSDVKQMKVADKVVVQFVQ